MLLEKDAWAKGKADRGILFVYVLVALQKKEMSGYEIIKSLAAKTGGKWRPSKGALYPLLLDMENRGAIKAVSRGKRGKVVYCLTLTGKKILKGIKKHKIKFRERLRHIRPIILEMVPKREKRTLGIAFQIHDLVLENMKGNENRINKILEECLTKLKKV